MGDLLGDPLVRAERARAAAGAQPLRSRSGDRRRRSRAAAACSARWCWSPATASTGCRSRSWSPALLMFVVVTVIVKRVTGSAVPTYDRAVWIELQTAALPLGFFLITLTLYTYIDTVILGIMRTDAETGWYAASYRVYEGLMYAPSAFATVLTPRFSQMFVDDPAGLRSLFRRSLLGSALMALVIGGAGDAAGAPDAAAVLRRGLRGRRSPPLQVLAGGSIFVFCTWILHSAAIATNLDRRLVGTTAIGLITNIALNILFIPRLGHHRRGVGDGDRRSGDRDAALRAGASPAGGCRIERREHDAAPAAHGRRAGRRAVRLLRLLLPGRRLEPELALRADPRDPRAAHAADRRVSAAHRRPRVLARPLLHRQGARRVAAGARSRCRRRGSFRAPPASIPRRFPASPGRRTWPRSSRRASSP